MKFVSVGILCFGFVAQNAVAFEFPIFGDFSATGFESEESGRGYDFRGIVALSNCSGSIVRFEQSQPSDRAMVLSNGHCVGMLKPGVVIVNQASYTSFRVLSQDAKVLGRVNAEKILYATMTSTDVSLFELKETYQDIERQYGFGALTLSAEPPAVGTSIEIISGYWKRGYSCQVETFVKTLKEASWTFVDSLRYSRPGCETIGGTSGSPVVEAGTRTVVAVNNTGNESGKMCEMNNPCEVAEDGTTAAYKGYSYAQQTYWFYSCLNDAAKLDLTRSGCLLPK
jgi:hypothetical protein